MNRLALVTLIALGLFATQAQAGTKLSRAAVDGNLQMVQNLVAAGEKVNEYDRWGWTPLLWAAYYGHPPIVKWLLDNGADPALLSIQEYGRYKPGTSALHLAAYYGHVPIVQDLLAAKADPSLKDATGKTAVEYAREFGFEACVALFPN